MNLIPNPASAFRRPGHWFSMLILTGLLSTLPATAVGSSLSSIGSANAATPDPVIAAAGDIACDPASSQFFGGEGTSANCRQKYTSNLLVDAGLAAVLDLGDNQYFCGGYQAFLQSYDPTWGRVKSITHPAVGNHEYLTWGGTDCTTENEGAAGYFQYFGSAAGSPGHGYYSFDVGAWHVIALDSACSLINGCGSGSPEYEWLKSDLATHDNYCTLAYWHVPLFSSGGRAQPALRPFWQLLYDHGADLVLTGHDHIYERFAPQDATGQLDTARGMREFVVGTGGANHTSLSTIAPNSQVQNTDTFGVLMLTLHASSYDWQFVHEEIGSFTDSGSGDCHAGDTVPPTAPADLTAASLGFTSVSLAWTASIDNIGVAGYTVYRNGVPIASVNTVSYTDNSIQPATDYDYQVVSYDAAGLESPPSNRIHVTTLALATPTATASPSPTPTPVLPPIQFEDGFERGNLSAWTAAEGITVQPHVVMSGRYAARARSKTGHAADIRKRLPQPQTDLYYRIGFNLRDREDHSLELMQFRSTAGAPLLTVYIDSLGRLAYRNEVRGRIFYSSVAVQPKLWQVLQVHLHIAGESSQVEVWYNGAPVRALTREDDLGTTAIGRLRLGESRQGLNFNVAFDGVLASLSYVATAPPALFGVRADSLSAASATPRPLSTPAFIATPMPSSTP